MAQNLFFLGGITFEPEMPQANQLSKARKTQIFCLVSTKSFSGILRSCSWDPGPDNLSQKDLNLSYLWHHTKYLQPKT